MEIRIHCPGTDRYQPVNGDNHPINLSPGDVLSAGQHDLVKLIAQPAHFEQILDTELSREGRGRLLVSGMYRMGTTFKIVECLIDPTVCVDKRSRVALKRALAKQMDLDVEYHEHEYQVPDESKRTLVLE